MGKKRFCYSTAPIDYWSAWLRLADYLAFTDERAAEDEIVQILADLIRQAVRAGWGPDLEEISGAYVAGTPLSTAEGEDVIVALKVSNNGTCFVSSPYALPWLSGSELRPVSR